VNAETPVLSKEFYTAAELAELALPGLPGTKRGINDLAISRGWQRPEYEDCNWRRRQGRGGGIEYHYRLLPDLPQMALVLRHAQPAQMSARTQAKSALATTEMWAWFERQPDARKAKARERLEMLDAAMALTRGGAAWNRALATVAMHRKVSVRALYDWWALVEFTDRADWLPYLCPRYAGGGKDADMPADAWEMLKGDYLRPEKPNVTDCIRRVRMVAAERGWELPSDRTMARRLAGLSTTTVTLRREGQKALKALIPAQQRDRGVLHALEVVNADGHRWDVFVRWPNGDIERPMMTAFQDVYSGKVLAWRVDVSENWHAVRLAFGDLVERYGIPDHCLFDNGRHYASKKITGGTRNRYRFRAREEEPEGILTSLGVQVHWATPFAGQSKPIERAFRDFAQGLAKHPKFAGAYTGNSPMAKPENYGKTAVPLDTFLEVIAEGIAEHNARAGRTGGVCRGRSFDQVFADSYAEALIRKATPEQRRLWLLAADAVTVSRRDASVELMGNRFWAEWLLPLRGRKVTVRFDPEFLQEPLHVYRADGAYLGTAECLEAAGFLSAEAAIEHNRKRRALMKHWKAAAAIENSMSIDQVAAMLPKIEEAAPPEARIVRPIFAGNAALKQRPIEQEEEDPHAALTRAIFHTHGRPALRAVPDPEDE
jgi:hypothetical protein